MRRIATAVRYPLIVFALLIVTHAARAQGTLTDEDVSVRSTGMGGASTAIFRGDPNPWANPALSAFVEGAHYLSSHTEFFPGSSLATDFDTRFTSLGWGGAGVVLAGEPFGPKGVKFDYADLPGQMDRYAQVTSWGTGVALLGLYENLQRRAGVEPLGLSKYFDVAVGTNVKRVELVLDSLDLREARARYGVDYGLLVRVTTFIGARGRTIEPDRIDLSFGWSQINGSQHVAHRLYPRAPVSLQRQERIGGAVSIASPRPSDAPARGVVAALRQGFLPIVSGTLAYDQVRWPSPAGEFRASEPGGELTIANVATFRYGRHDDDLPFERHLASGYSIGLPITPAAGFRFDHAKGAGAPESDLSAPERDAWAVWIDPFRVAGMLTGGR